MAKMAKDTQTDYTRGGKAISDTATPLYQGNLRRMDDYLENPQRSINTYLDTYFNPENAVYNDFLRNYTRRMANTTAHNYSATGGGYSTSGQRAYEDQQRHQNDLASRLRQYGIESAASLANRDFQNMRGANADYNAAYQLGKAYSDIERYNNMVDQNNSFLNQLSGIGGAVGGVLSAIPTPVTMGLGAALQGASALGSTDVSNLAGVLGAGQAGAGVGGNINGNLFTNVGGSLMQYANNNPNSAFGQYLGRYVDLGNQNKPTQSQTTTPTFNYTYTPYTSRSMAGRFGR